MVTVVTIAMAIHTHSIRPKGCLVGAKL